MRPLILHYHLFKNAGTSVEEILQANFGERWTSYDTDDPAGVVTGTTIAAMTAADERLVAISSHQVRPPLPVIDGTTVIPIVFLRHPLDRMQSVYDFDRRRGPTTPAGEIAAMHDFGDYIDVMIERNAHHVRNFHVRALTDLRDPESGKRLGNDEDDHARAIEFVRRLPAVGIVERYDESWLGLAAAIRTLVPEFAVHVAHANSAPDRPSSLDDRLDRMRSRLGPERYDRLVELNALDLDLYRQAVARLELHPDHSVSS